MSEEIGERVAVLEAEHKGVAETLTQHVRHCSKVQTYGLAIGCITLGLIVSDSPKIAKIAEIVVSVFAG